jgi:polyisoprenoid-binding protein YceI
MNINKRILTLAIVLLMQAAMGLLVAQNVFNLSPKQTLKVTGTSTLHDWEMSSAGAKGQASIVVENNQIKEIRSLRVEFPVKSLTSGNNRMDRTAYSSIDADKHPDVRFVLTRVRSITPNKVVAEGNLTIAGETRPVTLSTNYKINGNTIQFEGSEQIKFTQFDVKPPTALMGTVRTGDELQISFDVNFNTSTPTAR